MTAEQEALLSQLAEEFALSTGRRAALKAALAAQAGFTIAGLARHLGLSRQGLYLALADLTGRQLLDVAKLHPRRFWARPGPTLRRYPAFATGWSRPLPMERRRTRPRPSRRPHRKPLLLDALRHDEKPVFRAIEAQRIARRLGFRGPIRHLLAQLVEEGALVKLKFGTYGFGHRVLGVAAPHPFAVGVGLVKGAAIGALSALHYRGAVAQAPDALWLVTPRKIRLRHLDAGNLHVEVLGVKPRFFFGAEVVELDAFSHGPIFTPERALLDLFAHPGRFGGFHATFDVLEEALQHLVVSELVESTIRYSVSSVAKRIGWALERLGLPAKDTAPLVPLCVPQPLLLDSKRQPVGVQNPRWHVIENMDAARVGGSPKRRTRLS